jgi:hypothetical protein
MPEEAPRKVREGYHVKRYLDQIAETKSRPGRKPNVEALNERLAVIDKKLKGDIDSLERLALAQARRDLEARRDEVGADTEDGFVKYAAAYGRRKRIDYETWREVGVPANVLKRAGITPSNGSEPKGRVPTMADNTTEWYAAQALVKDDGPMADEAEASADLTKPFERPPSGLTPGGSCRELASPPDAV